MASRDETADDGREGGHRVLGLSLAGANWRCLSLSQGPPCHSSSPALAGLFKSGWLRKSFAQMFDVETATLDGGELTLTAIQPARVSGVRTSLNLEDIVRSKQLRNSYQQVSLLD